MLRTSDVMEELRVSRATIHNWKKRGLPFHKVSRSVFFDRNEVLEWVKNKEKQESEVK